MFYENCAQICNFHKFWQKSPFFENFVQNRDFWQFGQNQGISQIFSTIEIVKIFTKMAIFRFFLPKSGFIESMTSSEIFRKFDQNGDV